MTLIWLCSAFLLGIVATDTAGGTAMPCLIAAVVAGALAWVWRSSRLHWSLMLLAASALGAARDGAGRPQADATSLWSYANHSVVLTGTLEGHPDRRDDEQIVSGKELVSAWYDGIAALGRTTWPEVRSIRYNAWWISSHRSIRCACWNT